MTVGIYQEIERFVPGCEQEERDRAVMLRFLHEHPDALLRENESAHLTASAWVLSPDRTRVVMVWHNLYRSWSWAGGHADGEEDLLAAAMREVTEETGSAAAAPAHGRDLLAGVSGRGGARKARALRPSHVHLNVTYLLQSEDAALREKPDENSGVEWMRPGEALRASSEPWMRRWVYRKLIARAAPWMAQERAR